MESTKARTNIFIFITLTMIIYGNAIYHEDDPWLIRMQQADNVIYSEDDPWLIRMQQAAHSNHLAYNSNPENIISQLTNKIQSAISVKQNQDSKKYKDPCLAINPIDQCWRCQHGWAKHRKRLGYCALGFGQQTKGGRAGKIYIVTDPSDDSITNPKVGTLRHAAIQLEPLWIIFERDMNIRLSQVLIMTSNKTIDGRGVEVHIANGAGITLQFVTNIIIHGIHIHDIKKGSGGVIRDAVNHLGHRGPSDGDGISIFSSSNIWIDHVTMSNCDDGLIDAIEGCTAITILNSYFTNHNEVMLFGAHDEDWVDSRLQITVAFNHFGRDLTQRMPRVRRGLVHVVNNNYEQWQMYAIGGSMNPTILSHGNRFMASSLPYKNQVTKRENALENEWKKWIWRSEGDVFENGAYFIESGDATKFKSEDPIVGGMFARNLTQFSGALKCIQHIPC